MAWGQAGNGLLHKKHGPRPTWLWGLKIPKGHVCMWQGGDGPIFFLDMPAKQGHGASPEGGIAAGPAALPGRAAGPAFGPTLGPPAFLRRRALLSISRVSARFRNPQSAVVVAAWGRCSSKTTCKTSSNHVVPSQLSGPLREAPTPHTHRVHVP